MVAVADPDIELMLRVQRDEPGAFSELVAAYWARVHGRFVRQFVDRQEAEDLAQDVFLRVYRSRGRYRPQARLSTWVFFIARNVGRNAVRGKKRRRTTTLDVDPSAAVGDGSPSRRLERSELGETVRRAVAGLNNRQRRAVELQCDDRSYNEIASALAMSPKAAKSLLYRARNELRDALTALADDWAA